ncbi:MAG: hypothetical protein M3071_09790 [Actinomycetota bacterium]|nr:hypothetical protein [Actinomycetota bacterium]
MTSAVLELMILSVPSLIYARRLERSGSSVGWSRTAVGLRIGAPSRTRWRSP